MRSMLGPAAASAALSSEGRRTLRTVTSVLAVLELSADKLPFIPARTSLLPFAGRVVNGGVSAFFATRGERPLRYAAACTGAAAAVVSTRLSYVARRFISQRFGFPNVAAGALEDLVALALAKQAAAMLSR